MSKLKQRIEALVELGHLLAKGGEEQTAAITKARIHNPWFNEENVKHMLDSIHSTFLKRTNIEDWLSNYEAIDFKTDEVLAIVMAGNIPLVGFHDFLCGYILGYKLELKLSDKDNVLIKYIVHQLSKIDPGLNVAFVDRLTEYDKVIATGSSNTSMYFEQYFGHVPNIIRKNRASLAVIDNAISKEDMIGLGKDVLLYFGLGCRNVSKIYLPKDMDIEVIFKAVEELKSVAFHNKYMNNFDYSNALYLLNREVIFSNGFLIARENESLHSRISCIHFEYYDSINQVEDFVKKNRDGIQCVVSNIDLKSIKKIAFGQTQKPHLASYADDVDTLDFLLT